METLQTPEAEQTSSDVGLSPTVSAEKAQVKGLLAEARATREMLEDFHSAVITGTFPGSVMLRLAKGLAFVEAIKNQNKAHIDSLQERLK